MTVASGGRSTECFTTSFNLSDTSHEAGAAQYDSGGPVFIERNGEWRVAGLNLYLFGSNPYTGNAMGEISMYRDWIISNIPDYDVDMDGLPDWWETAYVGDAVSMEATGDGDGDGFSNYKEWIADTVPADDQSFPRIENFSSAGDITFPSSTNREYQIQYRTDLTDTNEAWQVEVDWFTGSYSQTVQSVSTATSNRFFRARVRL
jgi:hypothetical protein